MVPTASRVHPLVVLFPLAALAAVPGCGSDATTAATQGAGGATASGTGGAPAAGTGGDAAGGSASGGAHAGGDPTGGGPSTGGAGGTDPCGGVGAPCTDRCPGSLVCYPAGPSGGICIPPAPDCGGFAGARCEEPTPVCMTLSGADFGPCGTQTTKACVCAHTPSALADC